MLSVCFTIELGDDVFEPPSNDMSRPVSMRRRLLESFIAGGDLVTVGVAQRAVWALKSHEHPLC